MSKQDTEHLRFCGHKKDGTNTLQDNFLIHEVIEENGKRFAICNAFVMLMELILLKTLFNLSQNIFQNKNLLM